MASRIKLGELLVRAGVLDDFKLKAALAEQQRWGGRLGRILVEMNFVSEEILVKALSKQLGIPRADLSRVHIPGPILSKIDPAMAQMNGICPERYVDDKKTLVLAMSDPSNMAAVDELRFKTGLRVETTIAGDFEIAQAINRLYYHRGPVDGIELAQDGGDTMAFVTPGSTPVSPPQNAVSPVAANIWGPVATSNSGYGAMPPLPIPMPRAASVMGASGYSAASSSAPSPTPPQATPAANPADMAIMIEKAQIKQLKAIRVLVEMLAEKGIISKDEYVALVNRR